MPEDYTPTGVRYDDPALLIPDGARFIMNTVQAREYPELKGAIHIPVPDYRNDGATEIVQPLIDRRGRARVMDDLTDDVPLVGLVGGGEQRARARSVFMAYNVTIIQRRVANASGLDIDATKGMAAKDFVFEESEKITYLGHQNSGLYGCLRHPSLPSIASPVNFNDPNLNPADALNYLNLWADSVRRITGRHKATAMLADSRIIRYMNSTYRSTNSDATLMELFRKANPDISFVDDSIYCEVGGFNNTPCILFYVRNPDHVAHWIPTPFEQLIDAESQTKITVVCHIRDAGVMYRKSPASAVLVEGVWY